MHPELYEIIPKQHFTESVRVIDEPFDWATDHFYGHEKEIKDIWIDHSTEITEIDFSDSVDEQTIANIARIALD
jgi:hypothetical protein